MHQTWDLEVGSLSPGWCVCVEFLGTTLNSHSASLALGTKYWEVTREGLVSHSGGSRNTPSHLILQKPELKMIVLGWDPP